MMSLCVAVGLCLCVLLAQAPASTTADLISDAKGWVKELASEAEKNYREGAEANCFMNCETNRLSCYPLLLNGSNELCIKLPSDNRVFNNKTYACTPEKSNLSGPCLHARMFNASYVRGIYILMYTPSEAHVLKLSEAYQKLPWSPDGNLALSLDKISCEQQHTLCAQTRLDEIFKSQHQIQQMSNLTIWSMFGASNGIFRIYPGLELNKTTCAKPPFDPRKRPWYKILTGVRKEVVVMLDTSIRMTEPYMESRTKLNTFQASKTIVKDFLNTLTPDDKVWIYTFNVSGAWNMTEKHFLVHDTDPERLEAELQPLKTVIDSLDIYPEDVLDANLTKALSDVLSERFNNTQIANSDKHLRMLLIIAGERPGLSSPGPDFSLLNELADKQVRTFISQWAPFNSGGSNFDNISLQACAIKASYSTIVRNTFDSDHLAALQPFYSYLAQLRRTIVGDSSPVMVRSYDSYSGIGELQSIAYPAFDGDKLIGVASVAIPVESIPKDTRPNVNDHTLFGRLKATDPNCTRDEKMCNPIGSFNQTCVSRDETDELLAYDKRTCCTPGCMPTPNSNDNYSSPVGDRKGNINPVAIAAPTGAAAALVLAIIVGFLCWRRAMSRSKSSNEIESPAGVNSTPSAPHPTTPLEFNDPL